MSLVENTIIQALLADPSVAALIDADRIWPGEIPDYFEPPGPWVLFTVERAPKDAERIDAPAEYIDASVEFSVFTTADAGYDSAMDLALAIRATLDHYEGGQILQSEWQGIVPFSVEGGFGLTVSFGMVVQEALIIPVSGGLPRVVVQEDGLYFDGERLGEGDLNYVHEQTMLSNTWVVVHNLNKYPSVNTLDSAGTEVLGSITYNSPNQLTVTFNSAMTGRVVCN